MSSTPTATFGLLLSAVGLRCLVTAAFLGCGLGAGLAYGQRWGIFVSGSGDGLMAICGDCSVAAHKRAFRTLKSTLELRPMFHWTEARVRGHIMVCFLALVLESVLWRKLREQAPDVSYEEVLADLERLHAVQIGRAHVCTPVT